MITPNEIKRRVDQWEGKYMALLDQEKEAILEIEKNREQLLTDKGSVSLLQFIITEFSKQNEDKTAALASLALQEAFPDQQLSLLVEHTNLRGNPGVIFKLKDDIEGVEGDPVRSFGGGPSSLLGVVLRVISIVRQPGMDRILILDEPMAQVSKSYGPLAGKLLRKLCEPPPQGLGFKMLVVTHMKSIADAAHKRYHAEKIDGSLVLKEVTQEDISDE